MMGIAQIPHFIDATIDSLKIEGRMKSVLYVATTTSAYRRAIDASLKNTLTEAYRHQLADDLNSMPHRDYIPVPYDAPLPPHSTYEEDFNTMETGSHRLVGLVVDQTNDLLAMRCNVPVTPGTSLEFLDFNGEVIPVAPTALYDCTGAALQKSRPGAVVCIPMREEMSRLRAFTVIRGRGHAV
jgi:putative protease